MSIKTKLIILAITALFVVTVLSSFWIAHNVGVNRELEKQKVFTELRSVIFERAILRDDYLLHYDERPVQQFQILSGSIGELFSRISGLLSADEQTAISRLKNNVKFIDSAFFKIVDNSRNAASSLMTNQELERRVVGQVLIKSQEDFAIIAKLTNDSGNRVLNNQNQATMLTLIFLGGSMIFGLTVLSFIWISIVGPLIDLKNATSKIASLEFPSIITRKKAKDEIGDLSDAFNAMTVKLKKSYTQLAEARAKDEAILTSIGDAVIACDKDGRIMLFNPAAEDLSGFSAKEVSGRHYGEVLKFVREGDEKTAKDSIADAIATGRRSKMTNHILLITKSGRERPVADSAAPLKGSKGEVIGCVLVFHDITKEREIDRAKTEFVSLASHQLRTPSAAISWYAEMLLDKDVGELNKKQKEYIEQIYYDNKNMIELINTLLSVSRIDLGTFAIEPAWVYLPNLADDVLRDLQVRIDQKGLKIEKDYEKEGSTVKSDPKLLRVIIQNLIGNAVDYTPKGIISIRIKGTDYGARFEIQDSGCGIPESVQSKIYTKFFRADNARSIKPDGTGLGLYITKSVMGALGGTISFKSKEGEGTTFSVEIPNTSSARAGKELI